jgi:glycosyltransferase involved in cell wall biosynthesis
MPRFMKALSEPSLTICLPTYRRAKLLSRCLEKLYEQGDPPVNVIVGNNASPDNTEDVVQPYLGRVGFEYFRNDSNIGGDRNLVKIIGRVRTRFFLILTDDDYVDHRGLERVIKCCREYAGVGAIISPLFSMREDGRVVHVRGRFRRPKIQEPGLRSVGKHANLAWAWSRLVFARDAFDLAKAESALGNCYFMIIMLAHICRNRRILTIPERVVFHTIENEVYWDHIGPNEAERRLRLEQMMLAAMNEIYKGPTFYEFGRRWYYLNEIVADYIIAPDGLTAFSRQVPISDRMAFLKKNFRSPDGELGRTVYVFASVFKLRSLVRSLYRSSRSRFVGLVF